MKSDSRQDKTDTMRSESLTRILFTVLGVVGGAVAGYCLIRAARLMDELLSEASPQPETILLGSSLILAVAAAAVLAIAVALLMRGISFGAYQRAIRQLSDRIDMLESQMNRNAGTGAERSDKTRGTGP